MPSIALATCAEEANLFHDEKPLVDYLLQQGVSVFPTVWNSPEIDWSCYDLVVLRNTWDYHLQIDVFRAWLQHLATHNIPVLNPQPLLHWNIEKTYLKQLSELGIKILPTIFAKDRNINLAETLESRHWAQAVVKPIISGSGDNTWVITPNNAQDSQKQFDWLNDHIGMMLQPLAPQIQSDGEYSLVFLGGDYSHAVRKCPPIDDIFVHEERGGTIETITAESHLIKQAQAIIQQVINITKHVPSYARIDGFRDDSDFILMEFECIEPELYFTRHPQAAERLGNLIMKALK